MAAAATPAPTPSPSPPQPRAFALNVIADDYYGLDVSVTVVGADDRYPAQVSYYGIDRISACIAEEEEGRRGVSIYSFIVYWRVSIVNF